MIVRSSELHLNLLSTCNMFQVLLKSVLPHFLSLSHFRADQLVSNIHKQIHVNNTDIVDVLILEYGNL